MDESQIQQVRSFNRAVTQRIGVLSDDYLSRGRPLGESRLLFEIGRSGADLRDLRARLSLDSGYLSRMLRSLEAQGLVGSQRAAEDGRVRRAVLTRKGLREFDALDRHSQDFATSLLASLGATQRERMIAAMAEVERLMRASAVIIEPADPASADARACFEAYFRELEERFETGFDPARTVSADPEELVPPAGLFLLAQLDGRAVGCGALKVKGRGLGEIKRMWVAPDARGLGIAQRLLDALEKHAVRMGLDTLQLDTNRALKEAHALYTRNGYREIPRYNDNPYADHWFEKRGLKRGVESD
ncbi:bifunctional helix-turn-helix transcriptional regulator/GNAT family N-acetyltransferase [Pseudoxanthomonas sacheonensis]|uniref:DNA-binding MarR family transcriptional regulator/GNAT superfamily N-acetyltransferase n=1 Tax=Pseudoxanthomonas sacheonensis TaxID=443615 RepID=A0ABU1RQG1_9GAMM|nr:helix-turn-helix domain-containing GNAT family N-acetyltransferase [Pseudoxanthomonas sacheonensis]MDR6840992.1 DNA-binding MarR family transcriptional regulator/GNAT superfamily N-acetyltransferase [Pseudoxanthomonas sacheonensis]